MNSENFRKCEKLIGAGYVRQGEESMHVLEKKVKHFLDQQQWPTDGWSEEEIELLLAQLSRMDSNNFPGNCGAGEREGRVFSKMVSRRYYGLAHGIGRSGDITAVQPKAAGSSVISKLTNAMVLDVLRVLGLRDCKAAFVVPMATGMSLALCLGTLKNLKPDAKFVLWSRIDQKSCFKSILTAGLTPVVIENKLEGDELKTDLDAIEEKIQELGAEQVCCVMTTTSCFAPRTPDQLVQVGELCAKYEIAHLVNNAYGLQSTKCIHLLREANQKGRVDLFVQSTDKNFLVPVGGAIIAGFNSSLVDQVSQMYPGRASISPTLDLFITLLSMGRRTYLDMVYQRKEVFHYLHHKLAQLAGRCGEKLLQTPHNPISLALTISHNDPTQIGSMLFTKNISGTRVVARGVAKTIGLCQFKGYGSHTDDYPYAYLTAAAAVGMKKEEVDVFIRRLEKVLRKSEGKKARRKKNEDRVETKECGAGENGEVKEVNDEGIDDDDDSRENIEERLVEDTQSEWVAVNVNGTPEKID